jgi:hypothetical protein
VEALGAFLKPGDVVLVKASRSAGLERVALALTGETLTGQTLTGQTLTGQTLTGEAGQ